MYASIYIGGKKKIERVAMMAKVEETCALSKATLDNIGFNLALLHDKKDFHIFWHYSVEEMNMLPTVMHRKDWKF